MRRQRIRTYIFFGLVMAASFLFFQNCQPSFRALSEDSLNCSGGGCLTQASKLLDNTVAETTNTTTCSVSGYSGWSCSTVQFYLADTTFQVEYRWNLQNQSQIKATTVWLLGGDGRGSWNQYDSSNMRSRLANQENIRTVEVVFMNSGDTLGGGYWAPPRRGYPKAASAYKEALLRASQMGLFRGQWLTHVGISNGTTIAAFGLAYNDFDTLLDKFVFASGPFASDLRSECTLYPNQYAGSIDSNGGRPMDDKFVRYLMDLWNGWDYCTSRNSQSWADYDSRSSLGSQARKTFKDIDIQVFIAENDGFAPYIYKSNEKWFNSISVQGGLLSRKSVVFPGKDSAAHDFFGLDSQVDAQFYESIKAAPAKLSVPVVQATCSLSVSSTSIPYGQSLVANISVQGVDSTGMKGYWYGTKNGTQDANGEFSISSFSNQSYPNNSSALAGTYTRYLEVRDSLNRPVCRTNVVTYQYLASGASSGTPQGNVTCSASIGKSSVAYGDSQVIGFQFQNATSSQIAGYRGYWYGTKNGVQDANGEFSFTNFSDQSYPNNSSALAAKYTRYAEVRDSSNNLICRTNTVSYEYLAPSSGGSGTMGDIRGYLDVANVVNGKVILSGWACSAGYTGAVDLHIYAGGPHPSGALVVVGKTSKAAEVGVQNACGVNSTNPLLRFEVELPSGSATTYAGKLIYIYGIHPSGDGSKNKLIGNSGSLIVPTTTSAGGGSTGGQSVSCSLSVNSTSISYGDQAVANVQFTNASSTQISGYRGYWYGTKNGTTDVSGVALTQFQNIVLPYGDLSLAGTYTRMVEVRDSTGQVVCRTNSVTVQFVSSSSWNLWN